MNNSNLFKQAHALTRATVQAGDDYRSTFGLCYTSLLNAQPMLSIVSTRDNITRYSRMPSQFNATYDAIGYKAPRKAVGYHKPSRFNREAILTLIVFALFFLLILSFA